VGPRRALLQSTGVIPGLLNRFTTVGRLSGFINDQGAPDAVCVDEPGVFPNTQGNGNGRCNSIFDQETDDFDDLEETDVVGGNKFLSGTFEYRFPISEQLGLIGILFLDAGNAFAENDNIFDVGSWRYGTGFGVQWFSPFGPLQAFVGIPLNKLEVEDAVVFEFSVGGQAF
jgi:outer membrane protein assembly factor BamA